MKPDNNQNQEQFYSFIIKIYPLFILATLAYFLDIQGFLLDLLPQSCHGSSPGLIYSKNLEMPGTIQEQEATWKTRKELWLDLLIPFGITLPFIFSLEHPKNFLLGILLGYLANFLIYLFF